VLPWEHSPKVSAKTRMVLMSLDDDNFARNPEPAGQN
jgi:hypothetical protein